MNAYFIILLDKRVTAKEEQRYKLILIAGNCFPFDVHNALGSNQHATLLRQVRHPRDFRKINAFQKNDHRLNQHTTDKIYRILGREKKKKKTKIA